MFGLCAGCKETTEFIETCLSCATLVLPLDVTPAGDPLCLFVTMDAESQTTLIVVLGVERGLNPQPSEQALSNLYVILWIIRGQNMSH